MTLTINRKNIPAKDIFPTIDDFIVFLKKDYSNINFDNEKIKSSIISIYSMLINDDSNVPFLRLTRWLPSKFGFTSSSKLSLSFWIERGFSEIEYKNYSEKIFENSKEKLLNYNEKSKIESYEYDKDYSNLYLFNTIKFESIEKPNCRLCESDLILKKSEIQDTPIYLIKKCSNDECNSNNTRNKNDRWFAFLPEEEYNKVKNKLKSVKRAFSKEFWMRKGYSEEDSIKKVFEIQSENSKKFKGKRTGKNKEILRKKGYTEEQIERVSLSPSNIKFWTLKGHTEEEAKSIISKGQSHAAKFIDTKSRLLPSNLDYWIKRGYNEEDSKKKVKESQTTFSKEKCIEKFGYEKGIEVFNNRTDKWLNSLKDQDNIFIGYSKISQEMFTEISNRLKGDFKYATNGGEFKIPKSSGGFYFYDFVDENKKLIIEYNGDMYHANPDKFKEDDNPHPFRKNITSKEIWLKDQIKIKLAEELGYKVLIIWDSEYRYKGFENKEKIIERCINFLLQE
jgi:hypothetical protein